MSKYIKFIINGKIFLLSLDTFNKIKHKLTDLEKYKNGTAYCFDLSKFNQIEHQIKEHWKNINL